MNDNPASVRATHASPTIGLGVQEPAVQQTSNWRHDSALPQACPKVGWAVQTPAAQVARGAHWVFVVHAPPSGKGGAHTPGPASVGRQ